MCIYLFCSNLNSEFVKAGKPNLVNLHQTAVFTPICFRYKRNTKRNIHALFCCIRKQGILSIILYSPVNIHFCTDSCFIRISYSLVLFACLIHSCLIQLLSYTWLYCTQHPQFLAAQSYTDTGCPVLPVTMENSWRIGGTLYDKICMLTEIMYIFIGTVLT